MTRTGQGKMTCLSSVLGGWGVCVMPSWRVFRRIVAVVQFNGRVDHLFMNGQTLAHQFRGQRTVVGDHGHGA